MFLIKDLSKKIFSINELDISATEESSVVQIEGNRKVIRKVKIYNLNIIISVGYRVKSLRGVIFRRWANTVLKQYLIKLLLIYFAKTKIILIKKIYLLD